MTGHLADRGTLADAFDRAAASYDAMVALSPGYHEQLRAAARAAVAAAGTSSTGRRVVDLGCGSGASTVALLDALGESPAAVIGVDASAGMLEQARRKAWPQGVRFVHDDAVGFLRTVPTGTVDLVFAAYLLRNVDEPDGLLTEVRRVLRPGGALAVHDYSVAGSRRARVIWSLVCRLVIIPLSHVLRSDPDLHRYLRDSVLRFDSVEQICARLTRAGLAPLRHRTYAGWQRGLVHTVLASAPPA